MFVGEYNHSIDAKGRITVPSKFREMLGEHFTVTKGLDGCLWVYPQEEWDAFATKLAGLPIVKKDVRDLSRFFLAGAAEVEPDKMGRILLPQNLREFAGISADAVVVGVGKRAEIWSKDKWENASDIDANIDQIAERMGDLDLEL